MFWTFLEGTSAATGGMLTVDGAAGHHLARVLRVRVGERGVVVAAGRELEVEVTQVGNGFLRARVLGDRPVAGEPSLDITLLQSALPNPDFDAVIEAGTAVGVSRFVAVQADRAVARPAADRLARWQTIAASAAEQSHRGRIPSIAGPVTLSAALDRELDERRLLVLDPSSDMHLRGAAGGRRFAIAVGPEGGWTEDELELMRQRGGIGVHLGPRILRARLAPVIAAAILVQQS